MIGQLFVNVGHSCVDCQVRLVLRLRKLAIKPLSRTVLGFKLCQFSHGCGCTRRRSVCNLKCFELYIFQLVKFLGAWANNGFAGRNISGGQAHFDVHKVVLHLGNRFPCVDLIENLR